MTEFGILKSVTRICNGGVSIGEAYGIVADQLGVTRDQVISAYLKPHLARHYKKYNTLERAIELYNMGYGR